MGLGRILHPAWFQGPGKSGPYFEGWYFKMCDRKTNQVIAVIPGISRTARPHAFIQVISGNPSGSWYARYPIEEFLFEPRSLRLSIGSSRFSLDGIELAIDQGDVHLHGTVLHRDVHEFPVTLASPGIMGWYAYVPFMECFHGVVSTHHHLDGELVLNHRTVDFHGGDGYIEKDWGRSFPASWIWMQSNSFPSGEVSCMISVARIPFLGTTFTGFLGFVSIGGRLIRFATYTGANIQILESDTQVCRIVVTTKEETIEFIGRAEDNAPLSAPDNGKMARTITESANGTINLSITDKKRGLWFHETGIMAAIELSEADTLFG